MPCLDRQHAFHICSRRAHSGTCNYVSELCQKRTLKHSCSARVSCPRVLHLLCCCYCSPFCCCSDCRVRFCSPELALVWVGWYCFLKNHGTLKVCSLLILANCLGRQHALHICSRMGHVTDIVQEIVRKSHWKQTCSVCLSCLLCLRLRGRCSCSNF